MCGIVALYSPEKPIAPESLARATERLAHRGPDEQHHWTAPHGRVGLGHTRLSIIDLVTGAQPIASEDGRLRIVVNGEFYDHERIRRELEERGHRFRTRSDSEMALHLYEEAGAGCLERLRGEFAFVIWDEGSQTLFAARDRFGIKPLFYARVGGALYLASEAKALFAAGAPAGWDRESMFQSLFLCADQDRTLFEGVRQVPPGHQLVARAGSLRLSCYWDVNYPRARDETKRTEAECVEQLRSLLDEAVRLRVRADVPVGCYVSGGVDSSSVLGLAGAHAQGRVAAFTVAFDHPDYDESASARRTAAHAGADFWPVPVSTKDSAESFVEAVGHGEMIHYNAHGAARFRLSRAVRRAGYKVVLLGEGADELFAGYDFSRQALLTSGARGGHLKWAGMLARLLRPKTQTERRIARTSPWLARICRVLDFPPALLDYVAEKFVLLRRLASNDFLQTFPRRDPYGEFLRQFDWRGKLRGREPVKQILYLWMKSLFVNYVLAGERLDMAHAVEGRLPFLDHKLFEFARSLPTSLLARGGRQKHVLREAVRPFVTAEVYRGAKQPFFAPPATLRVGNPMSELLQDILRGRAFASVPFFEQSSVIGLLDELPRMNDAERAAMDPVIFMMASACVLQVRYGL
ncbi:MAG: asparagine synthase (glutamine-hydrolyzing) [Acidobacteria bacterium]|nr:asparagine synthase (glutamine-hydrolyzing) [Acidobacteriota bacterium]